MVGTLTLMSIEHPQSIPDLREKVCNDGPRDIKRDVIAKMSALYEDVEKFFGHIFASFGRFLTRHPYVFILVSLIVSLLLGLGLVNLKFEKRVEKLYTPMGSEALLDQARLHQSFPDNTGEAYYYHQLLNLGTYAEILVTSLDGGNVLRNDTMAEVDKLKSVILDIRLGDETKRGHTYVDLCASRADTCVIDGESVVDRVLVTSCLLTKNSSNKIRDQTGYEVGIEHLLSDVSYDSFCLQAKCLRMRFNLKHDTEYQRHLSLLWETKFLEVMAEFSPQYTHLAYTVSESLDIELDDHMNGDITFFFLTILIMVIYSTLVTLGGDWVSSRMVLACAGVFAALLAILATSGLLSMCGIAFVDICGVMPFLVLGIGVDNMFILMSGYRQTDIHMSTEERISQTYRTSAISVTITSLTDLLALCIGATSPFLSIKNFCIYAGVAVFFSYINQLTFFGGCLVLHTRRVLASRHCVTCRLIKPREELEAQNLGRVEVMFCCGHPPKSNSESDSPCEKIPNSYLPRLILHSSCKMLICILFVFYLGLSIWGASQIKIGLKLENALPDTSYLAKYLQERNYYFAEKGPPVMFVVTEPLNYRANEVLLGIHQLLKRARESEFMDTEFEISWLDSYLDYLSEQGLERVLHLQPDEHAGPAYKYDTQKNEFLEVLLDGFLPLHPEFEHDIQWNHDQTTIMASRFYVASLFFNDSTTEGNMMLKMRELAANVSLPVIAYSAHFIYYEHYVSVLKNTLLAVGVAIIGMLFIALMFIPHPIAITCVTITMVSIVLGMFGFMHFWGLELSAITSVQIILSVGFCVDFTIHISHAFMSATGKNRNYRVVAAMEKVGVPILNGAITSILGILMLGFAKSYVFQSFFKTMLLVMLLGLFHSVMLLPVLLSFVGPSRTSRPRVFIPMNASARSALSGPGPSSPKPVKSSIEDDRFTTKGSSKRLYHDEMEMHIETVPEEPEPEDLLIIDEYTMPARRRATQVAEEDSSVMDESFEDAKSLLDEHDIEVKVDGTTKGVKTATWAASVAVAVHSNGESDESSNDTDDTLVKSVEELPRLGGYTDMSPARRVAYDAVRESII